MPPSNISNSTVTPLQAMTGTLRYSTALIRPTACCFKGEMLYESAPSRPYLDRKRGLLRMRRALVMSRPAWRRVGGRREVRRRRGRI